MKMKGFYKIKNQRSLLFVVGNSRLNKAIYLNGSGSGLTGSGRRENTDPSGSRSETLPVIVVSVRNPK